MAIFNACVELPENIWNTADRCNTSSVFSSWNTHLWAVEVSNPCGEGMIGRRACLMTSQHVSPSWGFALINYVCKYTYTIRHIYLYTYIYIYKHTHMYTYIHTVFTEYIIYIYSVCADDIVWCHLFSACILPDSMSTRRPRSVPGPRSLQRWFQIGFLVYSMTWGSKNSKHMALYKL